MAKTGHNNYENNNTSNNQNNSFAGNQMFDFMKSFMDPEFYTNSVKNMPQVDMVGFSENMKKATKVLATTNQIATESMQSMMKKNAEILQNNAANFMNVAKGTTNIGDMKQINESQQRCVKLAYESSLHNAKELVNMAFDASMKIFEVLNSNITEQMNQAADIKVKV